MVAKSEIYKKYTSLKVSIKSNRIYLICLILWLVPSQLRERLW